MSQGTANTGYPISTSSKSAIVMGGGDFPASDEGSFFTCTQAATASTAVAVTTSTTGAANPAFAVQNSWPAGGAPAMNIYPQYLKLLVTTVSASNTSVNYISTLDPLQTKLTTITTALTPNNVNSASGVTSKALCYGGVLVAAAASQQARVVGLGQVTGAISVAFDEYIFLFGRASYGIDMIGTQTSVKRISVPMAPVIIAPGFWWTLGLWGASWATTALVLTMEFGWIERPMGQ